MLPRFGGCHLFILLSVLEVARASLGQEPPDTNYDESKVPKYAVASFHGGDIELDRHGSGCRFTTEGWQKGIRHFVMQQSGRTELADDQWGSIGAWAWGLSRVLDYLQIDPAIDGKRVAVFGHSRTGKTALWAAAQDERFALVISNNSGQGGASLARRRYGETVAASYALSSVWYCRNYQKYGNNEGALPVDAHMLIALIAPRPAYVASAEQDCWADPRGEFLAARHAEPVYELLGRPGLGVVDMPDVDRPVGRTIGYHIRTGDHEITPYDWERYLDFADRHLRKRRVLYNFDGDSCLSTKAGGKGALDFERGHLPTGQWKQAIPTVPVYGGIECTKGGGQKNLTADEYRHAAVALKKAGADGTYLFNFFTSREEGEHAYEPPFTALRDLELAGAKP